MAPCDTLQSGDGMALEDLHDQFAYILFSSVLLALVAPRSLYDLLFCSAFPLVSSSAAQRGVSLSDCEHYRRFMVQVMPAWLSNSCDGGRPARMSLMSFLRCVRPT